MNNIVRFPSLAGHEPIDRLCDVMFKQTSSADKIAAAIRERARTASWLKCLGEEQVHVAIEEARLAFFDDGKSEGAAIPIGWATLDRIAKAMGRINNVRRPEDDGPRAA